jgi:hypothetical protein
MRAYVRLLRPSFRLGRAGLATLLLAGIMVLGLTLARPARAASISVTTCDAAHLDAALAQAQSGDTITFGCDGTIMLDQTLTISTALILDGSGHTVALDGGGVRQDFYVQYGGNLTLNALTIQHGHAINGGGIINAGTLTATNSTIAANTASGLGGGIYNVGGSVTLTKSTVSSNIASGSDGGLFGLSGGGIYSFAGGTLTLANSTVALNRAEAAGGGGLAAFGGTLTVTNSTVAWNWAIPFVGGVTSQYSGGGGIWNNGSGATISGSIVAGNAGADCSGSPLTDAGSNLEGHAYCGFTGTGSIQNTDPKLASALANNGGPTQTWALLRRSPAIDAIPASSGKCPATDQRGVRRPDNREAACDIGAYEYVDHADDESDDASPPNVSCLPAAGATFAIGATVVTCTASDADDTNGPVSASFTGGSTARQSDLLTTVNGYANPALTALQLSALNNKLQEILTEINAGQQSLACTDLSGFKSYAQAQAGKGGITVARATALSAAATRIQAVLGC